MHNLKIYLFFSLLFLLCTATKCDIEDYEPTLVRLKTIEVANVNNEGRAPVISNAPIKKEAYMIGLRLIGDTIGFRYSNSSFTLADTIQTEKILCNTNFDDEHPVGSDVTSFFVKTENYKYIPRNIDCCFVLRKIPDAGTYSFKVCILCKNGKILEKDTEPINLY